MGILFALSALLFWGVGDFLIQRSTRAFGDWIALFFIDLFATIGLLPFVIGDIPNIFSDPPAALLLLTASVVITFAAVLDFEALRIGKLSVIEPVYALEVPVTVILGTFIAKEILTGTQTALMLLLMAGIMLVAIRSFHHLRRIHAERGVFIAVLATIAMGVTNFLFGIGARETDPIMINWFTSAFTATFVAIYLTTKGRWPEVRRDWRSNRSLIVAVGLFDNLAWLAYSAAALYLPIAIATGISESYIALAATLGIIFNREKLAAHQKIGLALAVVAVVALSFSARS